MKYYKNIEDLPIKIWFDIHESGNYNLLLISKTKITDEIYNTLHKCWESIYEQYIKEFGLSDDYLAHINIKKKIANLQADLVITGQKHFKTLIKIEREKMQIKIINYGVPMVSPKLVPVRSASSWPLKRRGWRGPMRTGTGLSRSAW